MVMVSILGLCMLIHLSAHEETPLQKANRILEEKKGDL